METNGDGERIIHEGLNSKIIQPSKNDADKILEYKNSKRRKNKTFLDSILNKLTHIL